MEWVLDHLQLIIVVGGSIAYWLNQRRKAKETEAEAKAQNLDQPIQQTSANAEAMAQAERTRRIQEEIRRKILERVGGGARPPAPLPPPLIMPKPAMVRVEEVGSMPDAYTQSTAAQTAAADQAVLDQQQQFALRLRELEAQRRQHTGRAEAFAEKTAEDMAASNNARKGSLLADLRDASSARRAIILREVLGTPVGLR
jgi:hypothetical protein